ncbi:Uncharacterized protein FWK35_00004055 [Aphis craccivora]|uniref:Uncharacterized protein n=1 Tax=Aphis craccivora TaxID=307492 RepID=A0A6G0Z2Y1_APHCR|nr:Uncharacterized protein FWK35_00004055 [Aphis craccivora]
MPYGDFKWVESNLKGLSDMSPTSDTGRVYEVDVSYPQHLHDQHNDLPFLPHNSIPQGSKVHRALEFSQCAWLADYISLNIEIRKKAKNAFEKDFFKLMNNAVKTMQSKRKEMKMELVSDERKLQKLINRCIRCNENLNAVALENKIITFGKPIYIVYNYIIHLLTRDLHFAVLDISKTLMYDYHYNTTQKHYGNRIKLLYTDTVFELQP